MFFWDEDGLVVNVVFFFKNSGDSSCDDGVVLEESEGFVDNVILVCEKVNLNVKVEFNFFNEVNNMSNGSLMY